VFHNKPQGCGALVAFAAGPSYIYIYIYIYTLFKFKECLLTIGVESLASSLLSKNVNIKYRELKFYLFSYVGLKLGLSH
jgi:hypothetical protein